MKRVLMQKLIQAAGNVDFKTLESLVNIAETMAERFPDQMPTVTDGALMDSSLWQVSSSLLPPVHVAPQPLAELQRGAEIRLS